MGKLHQRDKLKASISLRLDTLERVKRFQVQHGIKTFKKTIEMIAQNEERRPNRKKRTAEYKSVSIYPETYAILSSKHVDDSDSFDAVVNRLLDNGRKTTYESE
ncbi:MAG TPA: hypothetical protein DCM31_06560 [Deferribacteraceae bacterium]|nr:hypothetical protein [Deferribacteraceae bacterium]